MALTDKLSAIGEAIREKSGKSDKLTLDEMPGEIRALSAEEIIKHAAIPDYVKAEALDVANKVQAVRMDDSIVFLAMSDSHHYGEQGTSGVDSYVDASGTQTNVSNLHAAMAAKVLAYALQFDFAAHLGDATWGYKTTTSALLNAQIDELFGMLAEAHKGLPCFHAIGNHDTGLYYHNNQSEGVHTESGENLYNKFTAKAGAEAVYGGQQYGGYCYRDLLPDTKKLRVFLLNTSEYHVYSQIDKGMLGSQCAWLANALLDLNGKEDAAQWKWLVLSHYPADYMSSTPLVNILKAYVEGGSVTISVEDGTSHTTSFAGHNSARFVAQFHGHIHNFLVSKLHALQAGTPVAFDAWRVCIPNGRYDRENTYTVSNGVNFAEAVAYTKTAGTADDTSFVVNVINPGEEKIYSFCYGAGYDRVIGYAATVYYSITNSLSNVASDNSTLSVEEGAVYTATLTAADGYDMDTVTVTMGGEDVTASVVSEGVITIAAVTGNVVITATAIKQTSYTNQVRISQDESGAVYNGVGYQDGKRLNGSAVEDTMAAATVTGFIPFAAGDTIRLAGDGITFAAYGDVVHFYDSDHNPIKLTNQDVAASTGYSNVGSTQHGSWVTEDTIFTFTPSYTGTYANRANAKYIRISAHGKGANMIVTINEPIE